MKHFLRGLVFLICFFSSIGLSAAQASDSFAPGEQTKLYFDSNDLEISKNAMHIRLESSLIETNVIRADQQGLYIFENDITNYGMEKKWKCPYCNYWWPFGQKCQNSDCPTNRW